MRRALFSVLVVSAFNCLHTRGISISWVVLSPHHPNIRKSFLPSKVKGVTMGATVAVSVSVDCSWMTKIVIYCCSAAESVIWVCGIMACISAGYWMTGTLNTNCRLSHLIMLVVRSIEGNFMAVYACLLVMIAWTVPALNHATIVSKLILTSLVAKTILLLIRFIMWDANCGVCIKFSIHTPWNVNNVGTVSLVK